MNNGTPKVTWSLEDALNVVATFDATVAKRVHGESFAKNNPLPYQGVVFHELLRWRMRDTIAGVFVLCQHDLIVPAILLTRSAFELLAFTFEFHRQCEAHIADEEKSELAGFLEAAVLGVGKKLAAHGEPRAIHINENFKSIEKEHPGIIGEYDRLSEYAHPNRAGMLTAYAKINKEEDLVDLGKNNLSNDLAMTPLALCHLLFTEYSNRLNHVLKAINDKYETGASKFNIVGHVKPKPPRGG
jgi:hypothetical protein